LETGLLPGDFYAYEELLSDKEREQVERMREFLRRRVAPIVDDYWARAEFPFQLVEGFAKLGLMDWADPDSSEPRPSNLLVGIIALELAHADASVATFFGVHTGLAMGSILTCGSEEQKRRWLPAMSRFEKLGAFALTEPHGGSDVAGGLETTARRDGEEWVLDGAKRWIGNATFADLVVVWARDVETHQVLGFVVEKGTPGFTATKIENKMALRIVQNADIVLDGCRVREANRLQNANSFKDTAKILDLQDPTSKMSKSASSPSGILELLDDPKVNAKKIRSAVTDTEREIRFDEANKPGIANLLRIYAALGERTIPELERDYEGKGYGDLKKDLAELVTATFQPFKERTEEILADTGKLDAILAEGAEKAREVASRTLAEVYDKIGFLSK